MSKRINQPKPVASYDADPTSPTEGYTYFNTINKIMRQYIGGEWVDLKPIYGHMEDVYSIKFNELTRDPGITPITRETGKLWWDEAWETLSLGVGDTATLQLGQEFHILVQNDSGATITAGTLVMGELDSNGRLKTVADGVMKVVKAVTNGTYSPKLMLGIVTEDLLNGERGMLTTNGYVNDINTSSYNTGDILWNNPSVSGGLTATRPSLPNLVLPIAVVTKKSTNGSIYVRMTTENERLIRHGDNLFNAPGSGSSVVVPVSFSNWFGSSAPQIFSSVRAGTNRFFASQISNVSLISGTLSFNINIYQITGTSFTGLTVDWMVVD